MNGDPFDRIYTPAVRPPVPPVVAGDLSPAGVLQSGRDSVHVPPDTSESLPGYAEGASVSVPGTTGTLKGVVAHSGGDPGGYPTKLKTADGVDCTMDSAGFTAENANYLMQLSVATGIATFQRKSNSKTVSINLTALADDIDINGTGIKASNTSTGDYVQIGIDGKITVHNASNTKSVVIDAASLANNITIDSNGIKVLNASSSNYAKISEAGVITVFDSSGSKTLTIDPEAVTQNMAIKTWDVCDSGTPKYAKVLASDPYT